MTKILEEVREITSDAVAKKVDAACVKFPEIIKQIKGAASLGKHRCEFREHDIDEHLKKLLEMEGFKVWNTTKPRDRYEDFMKQAQYLPEPKTIWVVSW